MVTLRQIQPDEVKHIEFPEVKTFQFSIDTYKVAFTKAAEVSMSCYVRGVKIFKNGKLFNSGQTDDPDYLELTSFDNRYLFIPFRNAYTIFDLLKGTSLDDSVSFLYGNHFDKTGRYLLVVGYNEYKLTDLEKGKLVLNQKNDKFSISQAHFGFDNFIWTIRKSAKKQILEKVNPYTLYKNVETIPSPFQYFDIDRSKYQKLIDLNKHCVWISKEGGMLHSSLLDSWQYVKTTDKIVYRSAVPISEIRYSKNYNTDTCDTDYFYVTIEE